MTVSNSKTLREILKKVQYYDISTEEALHAIAALIEEAKPKRGDPYDELDIAYENGVEDYEQNLKELLK